MRQHIAAFKSHVRKACADPQFIHHPWFVKWHLELIEKIAFELCDYYPNANREMVELLVWVHDYGKIFDYYNEHQKTIELAPGTLKECGFAQQIIDTIMEWMDIYDRPQEVDLRTAPIEVQIVSSADGCAHLTGPFMTIFWQEFADRPYEDLMAGNLRKAKKDWEYKIVIPEARQAFQKHFDVVIQQSGELPGRFII